MPSKNLVDLYKNRAGERPSVQKVVDDHAVEPIKVSGHRWPLTIRWPADTKVAIYSSLDDDRYKAKQEPDGSWLVVYPGPYHLFVSMLNTDWVPTEQDCIDAGVDPAFLAQYDEIIGNMVNKGEILNIAPEPDVSDEDI